MSRPVLPVSALAEADRASARVLVAARAGQLAFSAAMIANDRRRFTRPGAQVAILVGVAVPSAIGARRLLRDGRLPDRRALWVDVAASATALLACHRGLDPGTSLWPRNVAIGSALAVSSAQRRGDAAAMLGVLCAAAVTVGRHARGRDAPVAGWGLGVNDALSWVGMSLAAGVYQRAHRRYAGERDDAARLAMERGVAAARHDERVRQHQALHDVTVGVLRQVAAEPAGPRTRQLARAEAGRLRRALHAGDAPPAELDRALADLAAAAPVDVVLVTGEVDRPIRADVADAVAAGVGEAVSAAAECGAADRVVVRASLDGGHLRVSVRDHGAGYDPDAPPVGYRARLRAVEEALAAVAGRVDLRATPGAGVRVEMSVPDAVEDRTPPGPPAARPSADDGELPAADAHGVHRTLLAALLTWRASGLATGAASVALGWRRLHARRLALLQLSAATGESLWLAGRLLRRDHWNDSRSSAVDVLTALAALALGRRSVAATDRATWVEWAPWSLAANVTCGQALAERPLYRRVLGVAAVAAGHGAGGPRGGDALVNSVAHAAFALAASLLGGQLRTGASRLASARAEAMEQGRLLARSRERDEQLSLLHDSAVQTLEAIAAGRLIEPDAIAHQALAEAGLLTAAGDDDDTPADVVALIRAEVADARRRGLPVDVEAVPVTAVPGRGARALAGACHESLTNASKYAGATRVIVRVAPSRGGVAVTVDDDGVGFDPASVRKGFGMAHSIIERMTAAGGSAEVVSHPGAGTVVTLRWPL